MKDIISICNNFHLDVCFLLPSVLYSCLKARSFMAKNRIFCTFTAKKIERLDRYLITQGHFGWLFLVIIRVWGKLHEIKGVSVEEQYVNISLLMWENVNFYFLTKKWEVTRFVFPFPFQIANLDFFPIFFQNLLNCH